MFSTKANFMSHKKRPEKKSESLDVRLPWSVKNAFMAATRTRDETASAAVRRFIDSYIAETEAGATVTPLKEAAMTVRRNPIKILSIATATAGALSLAALPSAADSSAFDRLDKNQDGQLIAGEIAPGHDETIIEILDIDQSGGVSRAEFDNPPNGVSVKAVVRDGEIDATSERKIVIKKISTHAAGDSSILSGDELDREVRQSLREAMPDATDEEIENMASKAIVKTVIEEDVVVIKE
jgi:hypothetical protein